jgi:hypothetical protein
LHTFTADIPAGSRLPPRNLIELVQHNNTVLSSFDVVVRLYKQPLNARFNVLADIASLRESIAIAYRERDVDLFT